MATGEHSFVDWLVRQDHAYLGELLRRRADLAVPQPADLTGLAARASTRSSVARAVDRLDTPTLQVLTAAVITAQPPYAEAISAESVHARFSADTPVGEISTRLADLRDFGLLFGPDDDLHVTPSTAGVLGTYPAGLGPSLVNALGQPDLASVARALDAGDSGGAAGVSGDDRTDLDDGAESKTIRALADPDTLAAVLDSLPAAARQVVDKLDAGNPEGEYEHDLHVATADRAGGVLEQLVARGVLIATMPHRLVLSREAGLAHRGGRVYDRLETSPEPYTGAANASGHADAGRRQARVDSLAAGAAHEVLRLVDELIGQFAFNEFTRLRAGGLGIRDRRKIARALDISLTDTNRLTELAYCAGLLGTTPDEKPVWLPSTAADAWRAASPGRQWQQLASAWFAASRAAVLADSKDGRGSTLQALGPGLDRAAWQLAKREVFELLRSGADTAAAVDLLAWRFPRAGAEFDEMVRAVLDDAVWLGLAGQIRPSGGPAVLASAGRAIVAGDEESAAARMAADLPERLEHVLLQADLTAIAPGPLAPELAERLAELSDVEGRGQGTVYRFGDDSIKRALGRGWDAGRILSFLDEHADGPVPQPLEYLVHDVARRFGRLRLGAARSYVRSDAPGLLDELMAAADHPAAPGALSGLRRIADTVVISQSDPVMLSEALGEAGIAVVTEAADGQLLVESVTSPRTDADPPKPVRAPNFHMAEETAADLADALQRAESKRKSVRSPGNAEEPAVSFALLREAIDANRLVRLGVSDRAGSVRRILVQPLSLSAGRLHVHDVSGDRDLTVVAHRLVSVTPVHPSEGE